MAQVELLLPGMRIGCDLARIGLGSVVLVKGRRNTLVDVAHYGRNNFLVEALKKQNLTPEDIHFVVLTHAHWDHCQNVDLFPRAQFIVHTAEIEYTRSPREGDLSTPRYFADTLRGLNVREITADIELEDDVRVEESLGHTRGHLSVLAETPEGTVVCASDAVSDADALTRGTPHLIFWDESQARESIRKLLAAGSIIYPGHDRPFRVNSNGSTEYIGGASSIRLFGALERGGSTVSVEFGLHPPRETWIHPEAKRS